MDEIKSCLQNIELEEVRYNVATVRHVSIRFSSRATSTTRSTILRGDCFVKINEEHRLVVES